MTIDLELRRELCEALGWPVYEDTKCPAYESDPKLSEELLENLCRERECGWTLHWIPEKQIYNCCIEDVSCEDFSEGDGETPSLARARAILAALRYQERGK